MNEIKDEQESGAQGTVARTEIPHIDDLECPYCGGEKGESMDEEFLGYAVCECNTPNLVAGLETAEEDKHFKKGEKVLFCVNCKGLRKLDGSDPREVDEICEKKGDVHV